LQEIYTQMWQNAMHKYQQNQFEFDDYLSGRKDTRRGITLIAKPSSKVRSKITKFLSEFSELEPDQYCQPDSDLHITIMSIVACRENYVLQNEYQYCDAVNKILEGVRQFEVEFCGITASPNCVLLQGFPHDESLNNLRNTIRKEFLGNTLEHSMDTRYTIKTAHSSVIRYRISPANPSKMVSFLKLNKERYFGVCKITELELVLNDWYQRKSNTRLLARYNLPPV
jgi:2'-5' RNA ligase